MVFRGEAGIIAIFRKPGSINKTYEKTKQIIITANYCNHRFTHHRLCIFPEEQLRL